MTLAASPAHDAQPRPDLNGPFDGSPGEVVIPGWREPLAEYDSLVAQRCHLAALQIIDGLLTQYPGAAELYLKRVDCLERLGRRTEIPAALNQALRLRPGWEPAVCKRAEHAATMLEALAPLPAGVPESAPPEVRRRLPPAVRQALATRRQARQLITDLNRRELGAIIVREPSHAHACFLLSEVLRHGATADNPNAPADRVEAAQWLDRAIRLAPERPEYRERRQTLVKHDKTPRHAAPS